MKTAKKKKTAKAVKKGSPSKTRGPAAGGAPLRLRVGRWYKTRGGRLVKVVSRDKDFADTVSEFEGCFGNDKDKYRHLWGIDGQVWSWRKSKDDLVREVPRPPRAK